MASHVAAQYCDPDARQGRFPKSTSLLRTAIQNRQNEVDAHQFRLFKTDGKQRKISPDIKSSTQSTAPAISLDHDRRSRKIGSDGSSAVQYSEKESLGELWATVADHYGDHPKGYTPYFDSNILSLYGSEYVYYVPQYKKKSTKTHKHKSSHSRATQGRWYSSPDYSSSDFYLTYPGYMSPVHKDQCVSPMKQSYKSKLRSYSMSGGRHSTQNTQKQDQPIFIYDGVDNAYNVLRLDVHYDHKLNFERKYSIHRTADQDCYFSLTQTYDEQPIRVQPGCTATRSNYASLLSRELIIRPTTKRRKHDDAQKCDLYEDFRPTPNQERRPLPESPIGGTRTWCHLKKITKFQQYVHTRTSTNDVIEGVRELFSSQAVLLDEDLGLIVPGRPVWPSDQEKISAWKETAGRSKEWRRSPYVKTTKKVLESLSLNKANHLQMIGRRPEIMQVTINGQRRYRAFERTPWYYKKVSRSPKLRHFATFVPEDDRLSLVDATDESILSGSEETTGLATIGPSLIRDEVFGRGQVVRFQIRKSLKKKGFVPFDFNIPPESFIGSVLGSAFRVLRFIRSEGHGNVYAVEALSGGPIEYEAKAFVLRHISAKEYQYRIRNLKRLTNRASFVCSFDQNGKKFLINKMARDQEDANAAAPKEVSDRGRCQFGAIGRRGTFEFEKAFPILAQPSVQEPTTNGISKPMKPPRWPQELPKPDRLVLHSDAPPSEIRGYSDQEARGYATVLSQPGPNDLILSDGNGRGKQLNREQAERRREKQRLSRRKNRLRDKIEVASEGPTASKTANVALLWDEMKTSDWTRRQDKILPVRGTYSEHKTAPLKHSPATKTSFDVGDDLAFQGEIEVTDADAEATDSFYAQRRELKDFWMTKEDFEIAFRPISNEDEVRFPRFFGEKEPTLVVKVRLGDIVREKKARLLEEVKLREEAKRREEARLRSESTRRAMARLLEEVRLLEEAREREEAKLGAKVKLWALKAPLVN